MIYNPTWKTGKNICYLPYWCIAANPPLIQENIASLTYLQEGTPKMFYFSHKNQYPNFFFFLHGHVYNKYVSLNHCASKINKQD